MAVQRPQATFREDPLQEIKLWYSAYLYIYIFVLHYFMLKVGLVEGHNLLIEKSQLKMALTIGRLSKSNLNGMVNKLMEGIYTRDYMSKRSLSGKAPRKSRSLASTPTTPTKPGLPVNDVTAIISNKYFKWARCFLR